MALTEINFPLYNGCVLARTALLRRKEIRTGLGPHQSHLIQIIRCLIKVDWNDLIKPKILEDRDYKAVYDSNYWHRMWWNHQLFLCLKENCSQQMSVCQHIVEPPQPKIRFWVFVLGIISLFMSLFLVLFIHSKWLLP